uniref:Peptidase A2 domain-containing protein n=1 Tax=Chromera velia CCMP2878 TaxID=1169474 RepID=A0A0G4HR97_9ALVE|eukprot:Cvel_30574.t1-p1 / transcript=Cvel_30574.t1 / gene=Cvel_30574 / organism=Chromera_velia_CCMP2878 / gene_product=hypothetical protein / transcript_product=hypothetical protein / location=Cvel_scaffold4379:5305-6102(+) / protein_length=266 / sequence_SO=supercontig / SO=protein_coding / is_pseudo=false
MSSIALVNGGADISLMSNKVLSTFFALRPSLRRHFKATDVRVVGEGNSPLQITGFINLTLSSFARPLRHTFYICSNLMHDMILGMDWLIRHAKSQSFEDSKLTLQSRFDKEEETEVITLFPLTELQREKASLQTPTLSTARTVIPPRSGVHAQVKLPESSGIPNGAPVLLERIAGALPAHLAIGNSVSIVEDRELTLNVINVSKKHAAILKERPLALATLCKNFQPSRRKPRETRIGQRRQGVEYLQPRPEGHRGQKGLSPTRTPT